MKGEPERTQRVGRFFFGVVILAAGASTRMGEAKLLLPWGGTTVLGEIVNRWRSLGAGQIAAVVRKGDEKVEAELRRLGFAEWIVNDRAEEGMFSSVQAAALWNGWKAEVSHFVVVLGDQPQIGAETLRRLLEFAGGNASANPKAICQPALRGRAKHPVILPKAVFRELGQTSAGTLREFLDGREGTRRYVEVEDESLGIDLDTPEDYRAAVERFGGKNGTVH